MFATSPAAESALRTHLASHYGVMLVELTFMPRGADMNAAVYRAVGVDGVSYFAKLRRGVVNQTSILLPKFLAEAGIAHVIVPLATQSGALWVEMRGVEDENPDPQEWYLILYPFIDGQDGFQAHMAEHHWRALGAVLRQVHMVQIPEPIAQTIRRETYSAHWCERLQAYLDRLRRGTNRDPVATRLAALLQAKRDEIDYILLRAEQLRRALASQPRESTEYVLCHSDIHAGNVLLGAQPDGTDTRDAAGLLFVVDWDDPIYAPRERDLMFIGGGVGGVWHGARETAWFYAGYGQVQMDPVALAYYRYARIVEDLALYCEQVFDAAHTDTDTDTNRNRAVDFVRSNFLPNHTLAQAYAADARLST